MSGTRTNWQAAPALTTWRTATATADGTVDPTQPLGSAVGIGQWLDDGSLDMYEGAGHQPILLDTDAPQVAVPQRTLRLTDPDAEVIYDVVIAHADDGEPYITALSIYSQGARIDDTFLRRLPARALARYAAQHFADETDEQRPLVADGPNDDAALRRPSAEEFATAWLDLRKQGHPVRTELAQRYAVSVHAIDKWTRQARDAGLIPIVKAGRPRNRSLTDRDQTFN